jgi:hypothetical protein
MSVHPISSKYSKGLKSNLDSNTAVVGDFNVPPSPIDRSSKQKKSIKKF